MERVNGYEMMKRNNITSKEVERFKVKWNYSPHHQHTAVGQSIISADEIQMRLCKIVEQWQMSPFHVENSCD